MSEQKKIDWDKIKIEDIKKLSASFAVHPTTVFKDDMTAKEKEMDGE